MKISEAFPTVREQIERDKEANKRDSVCKHWWYWVRPSVLMCKHCQSLKINGELFLNEVMDRR